MSVKWKKNRYLKPEVIVNKLASIMSVSPDKKVSFDGFEYQYAMAALQSMVIFPCKTEFHREFLLSKAVGNAARKGALTSVGIIDELNILVGKENAKRESVFYLLGTVSLRSNLSGRILKLESCELQLFDGGYPNKFSGREEAIKTHQHILRAGTTLNNYTKLVVSTKAKGARAAFSQCMKALDLQRAIWNLFSNSSMELIGNEWEPINRVRLGEVQTVHDSAGVADKNMIWYEPNFVKATVFFHQKADIFNTNCSWFLTQLEKCKYSHVLKDALLLYVRALDERDQNVAFIRLWTALESITTPGFADYDLPVRRCSFLFVESEYHRQVLEHLRECRNKNVHAGDQNRMAKTNCFQLQMYITQLILFHLNNVDDFNSLNEANEYLDLPVERTDVEKKKKMLEKVINFRWPSTV